MAGQSQNQFSDVGMLFSGKRSIPSRLDAEKALLGCLLEDPKLIAQAAVLKFATAFYHSAHQIIFALLLRMDEESHKIDSITVSNFLEKEGDLDAVGGVSYLLELQDSIPTTANVETYISIVKNYGCIRAMIRTFSQGINDCFEDVKPAIEIIDEVEQEIGKVAGLQINKEGIHLKSAIKQQMSTIIKIHELRRSNPNALLGISTGFGDIDKKLNGLKFGEMYVLAARPSMGKTTLAMNIAVNVALSDKPVAIFSLEMDAASLAMRLVCAHSKTTPNNVYGKVKDDSFTKFMNSSAILSDLPIYIDDNNPLNIMQIRARSRRLKQKHNIGLIIIDYLQIISNSGGSNREREVAKISAGIKTLAKELEVPVMVLAQLNRSAEGIYGTDDKRVEPGLEHLRESGSIEQDADVVAIIDGNRQLKNKMTSDIYNGSPEEKAKAQQAFLEGFKFKLLIAKNRNGETGPVNLRFFPQFTCFKSVPKVSEKEKKYDNNKGDNHEF